MNEVPTRAGKRLAILILIAHYPPAFLAGGPTKSVSEVVKRFSRSMRFRVITSAHDLGRRDLMAGIKPGRWTGAESRTHYSRTLYLGRQWAPLRILRAARSTTHDVLYLNSVFSVLFTLVPLVARRIGLIPRRGLVIAPRGELDEGALSLKPRRKAIYLSALRRLGLVQDATWHATTDLEVNAIVRSFGPEVCALVAPNIAVVEDQPTRMQKRSGHLRAVYLSRIAPKKNLRAGISYMATVRGKVEFDIYGPIEDPRYWDDVQGEIAKLPPNIRARYGGTVPVTEVSTVLASYDLFLLPTLGENYGHAIVEALSAGCPVLISDRTPWRHLEGQRAGWAIPLAEPERFSSVIQDCVGMTSEVHQEWAAGARGLAIQLKDDAAIEPAYWALFGAAAAAAGDLKPGPA